MMFKKAFTMIELIFVIVVMGIIGTFGIEILAQSYNSFIYSKINNELQGKSNHAVELIAKRLEYRIPTSTIKRVSSTNAFVGATQTVANADAYNVLEWIGYDVDGYRGTTSPAWSGIIDFDQTITDNTQLNSPDTNTTYINSLIQSLSHSGSTIANAAIVFNAADQDPQSFGWSGGDALIDQSMAIHPVTSNAANIFISGMAAPNDNFNQMTIYNRYRLAWTAYAIFHDPNTEELRLHFDYQPWEGEAYGNAKSFVIMEDVSEFRIKPSPDGRVFSIKVCVKSNLTNEVHSLCKEKTIF